MSEQYKALDLNGGIIKIDRLLTFAEESARYSSSQGVIICDVDGCIRDGRHRIHLLPTKEEVEITGDMPNLAFTKFNEQSHLDSPIKPVIDMMEWMWLHYYIVVLTSCTHSNHTLKALLSQLNDWEVHHDAVVMRGKDNHRWPVDFKQQFIYDSGLDKFDGAKYALDDCPKNCDMFRENGFTALQVENWSRFNK